MQAETIDLSPTRSTTRGFGAGAGAGSGGESKGTDDVPIMTPDDELKMGVYTIADVLTPPDVNRDDDDDDSTLPYEKHCTVPPTLLAKFPTVEPKLLKACRLKYSPDGVVDDFNDLSQNIERDDLNIVTTTQELVDAVNEYDYDVTGPGDCIGRLGCLLSCGIYHWCAKRKIVEQDKLGHYRSNGRDMLLMPGAHSLVSMNDTWVDWNVPKDDEANPVRHFGSKTIITIGENCLGGAKRIGAKGSTKDGDYVMLRQGRHVLSEELYSNVEFIKLNAGDVLKLGPLTILYVKEGHIGGAFHRNTGRYKLFLPGPPYVLHEKNYEKIKCVKRDFGNFRIGPVQFLTVKDGEIGGAYHKRTGLYQVLPPGNTYILHEKDYQGGEVHPRTDEFKLGPYFYLTVRNGYCAGAYRVKGGKFIDFPPGFTYQCNEEDYVKPICVKKDSHMIVCGPKTFLTVKKGTLNGAYRVTDGQFEEFTDEDHEYVLHEKEYRDIITIPRISEEIQKFGPFTVVTVKDNHAGVFVKSGRLEIKESGFYKLDSDYRVRSPIPLNTFTEAVNQLAFSSKDRTEMSINANVAWAVTQPDLVAIYPGGFAQLRDDIVYQIRVTLVAKCATFNRDEILPTKQDIIVRQGDDISEDEAAEHLAVAERKKQERYTDIMETCMKQLKMTAEASKWGIDIVSLTVKGFVLHDEQILANLENIARSIMETKAQKVQSALVIEKANTEREAKSKKAEADAYIAKKQAEADAAVQLKRAQTEAEVKKQSAIADSRAAIEMARAQTEAKIEAARAETQANVVRAEADAKAREIQLEIENRERKEKAESEAAAIKARAEADFYKKNKENEAAKLVPEHEIQFRLQELKGKVYSDAIEAYSSAAWNNPTPLNEAMRRVEDFVGVDVPTMMMAGSGASVIVDGRAGVTGDSLPGMVASSTAHRKKSTRD